MFGRPSTSFEHVATGRTLSLVMSRSGVCYSGRNSRREIFHTASITSDRSSPATSSPGTVGTILPSRLDTKVGTSILDHAAGGAPSRPQPKRKSNTSWQSTPAPSSHSARDASMSRPNDALLARQHGFEQIGPSASRCGADVCCRRSTASLSTPMCLSRLRSRAPSLLIIALNLPLQR